MNRANHWAVFSSSLFPYFATQELLGGQLGVEVTLVGDVVVSKS